MRKTLLFSLIFILLFSQGFSAEDSGTTITLLTPHNQSIIDITPQTSIPFTFYFTSSVSNASCVFYLKSSKYNQTIYDFNCTVYNNTLTIFYPNATITDNLYSDNIQWIVNCSIGCEDWTYWKDADDWQYFTYDHITIERELTETGQGIGALLATIKGPLFSFVIMFSITFSILVIWNQISENIGNNIGKNN